VYVKVKKVISEQRMSLSMKEVDQNTGKDLLPSRGAALDSSQPLTFSSFEASRSNPPPGPMVAVTAPRSAETRRPVKRMTTPELWELKQLKAAGVMDASELQQYDEAVAAAAGTGSIEEPQEELEVEMREDEPVFLHGQVHSVVTHSPVKVVANPEGSLQRAAMAQSSLAKERREIREQQRNSEIDAIPRDLGRPWEDPMSAPDDRHIAAELRGLPAQGVFEMPEWKKDIEGKNVRFGQSSTLPLREQRAKLPIWGLKEELVKAVMAN
jgi:ATP-dependent RNA helicase DHX8/PRP22